MKTSFADFNLIEAISRMRHARIFLRRRDPILRGVLKALLPEDSFTFIEVGDAALLLREVSGTLLSWKAGETLEITMSDRLTSDDGHQDIVVGFRRPGWNAGVILVTAMCRTPDGDEQEYGSALVLGPGVALSIARREPLEEMAADCFKLAG